VPAAIRATYSETLFTPATDVAGVKTVFGAAFVEMALYFI